VDKELFRGSHDRTAVVAYQPRLAESPERQVYLRSAERKICCDLGDRRSLTTITDQLGQHHDILRQ
jgi:hypothetical protein